MSPRPTAPAAFSTLLLALAVGVHAQNGQPTSSGSIGQFKIVGNSLVSAQQVFLGTADKIYIVDKTENNPAQIEGHPAWASEWSQSGLKARAMDIVTNTFCAGGNVLGNGTWLNVGGNEAVGYGGVTDADGTGPYQDTSGGYSIRTLNPCDDESCNWNSVAPMTTRRWYPTLETLEDGSMIIIGGDIYGGYVNSHPQNNPTYEFFPSKGAPIESQLLLNTLPANLYPLTWLLPSGTLLMQSNWATILLDYHKNEEFYLQDIPDAVRTYPASAGSVMFPLTPANNWTATVMFCGGSNIKPAQWYEDWDIAHYAASDSCVTITPDVSGNYTEVDPLPEGRTMGNLIMLPNQQILCLNGARTGTAGYGNVSTNVGQSYADQPILAPIIYDPTAPAGSKWTREGLSNSTVARMYHSTATLLPDGSVFVSGSNPNSDYNITAEYPTEYRVETWYPSYYNERRPVPQGLPSNLSYGGDYFNVTLTQDDLFGDANNVKNASVIVIRTGFSTHTINMGQRFVQLDSTYTGNADGSATLQVAQMPPNPAILAPGPAFIFVVVNGVPSIGQQIMVGSGKIGTQKTLAAASLPPSSMPQTSSGSGSSSSHQKSSSTSLISTRWRWSELFVISAALTAAIFA